MRHAAFVILVFVFGLFAGAAVAEEQPSVEEYKGYALLVIARGDNATVEQIEEFLTKGMDGASDQSLAAYRAMLDFAAKNKLGLVVLKHRQKSAPRLDLNCDGTQFFTPDQQPGASRIGKNCVVTTAHAPLLQHLSADKDFSERIGSSGISHLRIDDRAVSALWKGKAADVTGVWDLLVIAARNIGMS